MSWSQLLWADDELPLPPQVQSPSRNSVARMSRSIDLNPIAHLFF
jgi:hypothetical protein